MSPTHRSFSALALAFALGAVPLTATNVARADLMPGNRGEETCTIEQVQREGETCVACSTFYGEPQRCEQTHGGANGHALRCRTGGASTWTEIWCRSGSAEAAPAQPTEAPPPPVEPATAEPAPAQAPSSANTNTATNTATTTSAADPAPAAESTTGLCAVAHTPGSSSVALLAGLMSLSVLGARRLRRRR